jgi:hypothetical protein
MDSVFCSLESVIFIRSGPAERLFISFSPGFNRVTNGPFDFPKPFQRFAFQPMSRKPLKRFD